MKILCLCEQGVNRSTTLATILKNRNIKDGQAVDDILVAGCLANTSETLKMLGGWADKVLVVDQLTADRVKGIISNDKVILIDVGPDKWGYLHHGQLQNLICVKLAEVGF